MACNEDPADKEVPECDTHFTSSSEFGLLMRAASSPGKSCGPADNIMSLWLSATQSASCTCCKGCRYRHGSGWLQSNRPLTSWLSKKRKPHRLTKGCRLNGKEIPLSTQWGQSFIPEALTLASCMNNALKSEVDWSALWYCIAATSAALISWEVWGLIRPHWMNRHLPAVREGTLLLGVAPVFGLGQMHR